MPGRWTLRHVILVLRDEALFRRVLDSTEATRHLLQYCEHAATFQNILSTILTRIAPYEIIAAAWDRAGQRLSLRRWLDGESLVVLGHDEDNRAALDTMNQLIFKRLSGLILAQPELSAGSSRLTWILLDEVRLAGRLDGLSALMTKGRSKGAAVLLGFQDIGGLREVYGREAADELVGQCNAKVILRLNSPETARWASQVIGASEFVETRKARSRSRAFRGNGFRESASSGVSSSDNLVKRVLVLDSEFLDLPETSPEHGLTGYFISSAPGVFRDHLGGAWPLIVPGSMKVHHLRAEESVMPTRLAGARPSFMATSDERLIILSICQSVDFATRRCSSSRGHRPPQRGCLTCAFVNSLNQSFPRGVPPTPAAKPTNSRTGPRSDYSPPILTPGLELQAPRTTKCDGAPRRSHPTK